jgi:hypothetical protein
LFIFVSIFSFSALKAEASCYSCEEDCYSNRVQNNRRIQPQRKPLLHRPQIERGRNYQFRKPLPYKPSVRQPLPPRDLMMFR